MSVKLLIEFNKFPEMPLKLESAVEQIVDRAADKALEYAESHVPVDKGDLKASLKKVKVSKLEREVKAGTDHCIFVEYGTRRMAAQPYLTPAAANVTNEATDLASNLEPKLN